MKRKLRTVPFLAFCILAATSLSAQAALTEWALPSGSQPLQIDASSPTGNVYFVDRSLLTINQLGGSFLISWPAPFTPSTPGSIVVEPFAAIRFVYVTDLPGTTLGQLDMMTNTYNQFALTLLPWNVSGGPRQLVYDNSQNVAPIDVVWFSASGDAATGSPALIGYLAPSIFAFRVWLLPASIASPGDAIDGLAFVRNPDDPLVFFTVSDPAGSGRNNLARLRPLINQVTAWPLPPSYSPPVPIVATRSGEVYRVMCGGPGCATMARIRTTANLLDEWTSAVDTTDIFLTLDPATLPRFTGTSGGMATADRLNPACDKVTTPLIPIEDIALQDFAYLQPNPIPLQPIFQDTPPHMTNLNFERPCPFHKWSPISSGGPISMDNLGGTWISETAASFIANF